MTNAKLKTHKNESYRDTWNRNQQLERERFERRWQYRRDTIAYFDATKKGETSPRPKSVRVGNVATSKMKQEHPINTRAKEFEKDYLRIKARNDRGHYPTERQKHRLKRQGEKVVKDLKEITAQVDAIRKLPPRKSIVQEDIAESKYNQKGEVM